MIWKAINGDDDNGGMPKDRQFLVCAEHNGKYIYSVAWFKNDIMIDNGELPEDKDWAQWAEILGPTT